MVAISRPCAVVFVTRGVIARRVLNVDQSMRSVVFIPSDISDLIGDTDQVAVCVISISPNVARGIGDLRNSALGVARKHNALAR